MCVCVCVCVDEGKAEHLSRAGSHIRWRQGTTAASSATTAAAEPAAGPIRLEEFNFPRGFQIRASSELCRMSPSSVAANKRGRSSTNNDGDDDDDGDAVKNGCAEQPDRERSAKEQVVINVPDVRQCAVCRMVFHSSVSLQQHMTTDHRLTVLADATTPDKPLDLSSPGVKTESSPFQPSEVPHLLVEMADLPPPAERGASKCRKFLCLVCFREYADSHELLTHQAERHPNIDCRHIEVDQDFESLDVGLRPRTVGLLNVSSSQLPALPGTRLDAVTDR